MQCSNLLCRTVNNGMDSRHRRLASGVQQASTMPYQEDICGTLIQGASTVSKSMAELGCVPVQCRLVHLKWAPSTGAAASPAPARAATSSFAESILGAILCLAQPIASHGIRSLLGSASHRTHRAGVASSKALAEIPYARRHCLTSRTYSLAPLTSWLSMLHSSSGSCTCMHFSSN